MPFLRVVAQAVDSATLLVDNVARTVAIGRGSVVYLSFLETAPQEQVRQAAQSLLRCNIFVFDLHSEQRSSSVSIIDAKCEVLVVPQASLAGKWKGKSVQYHGQAPKSDGKEMYATFCSALRQELQPEVDEKALNENGEGAPGTKVMNGSYGNRQALHLVSSGPQTHFLEF